MHALRLKISNFRSRLAARLFSPKKPIAIALYRGGELLGTVEADAEHSDFPWYGGRFRSTPAFAAVEPLFAEEWRLLAGEDMDGWGRVWAQLEAPGLRLVPVGADASVAGLLIHIHIVEGIATWRS